MNDQLCAERIAARVIERWAVVAFALLSAGALAAIVAPALHHLFAAITLALTLPGLH